MALYGGPSYNYSYQQELDPIEMQYLQGQALQESQQLQHLGQSNYQVGQSFSQSYWQRYHRPSIQSFGTIPEDSEVQEGAGAGYQRRADRALESWKMGPSSLAESQDGRRNSFTLNATASSVDLKEFLSKRGEKNLQGLHKLASQGDRNGIMNYMKKHGPSAPIDELDSNGCTPLMYAAIADSQLAIEMLLNFSAKREQRDSEGRTAVHYAAFFGKHRALKFLISTASDWTPIDSYGRTPLHWSCASKSTQSLAVLLKHAQVVMGTIDPRDYEGMTPLHCAAHFCRPQHIALLHEAGCDFTAIDCEQKTALHWTATNPSSSCMQTLLEIYPSLLNKQDGTGSCILHYAAQSGATHLMASLVEIEGIDLDVKDNYERTALHWACADGHSDIVRLLLSGHALDSCIDTNGQTALHYCIESKSVLSVEHFVALSEMTHLPNNEGRTPLMEAASRGMAKIVVTLLRSRAVVRDIDHKDPQGMSSLHLAAESGSNESVSVLLSSGADPNLTEMVAKKTPIFLAAQNGHGDCVQSLISKGAELDLLDVEGHAPLHKAVMYNQLQSVQVLAINGANLNITEPSGNTALHIAAYGGVASIVTLLLEQSANPNLQDNNGVSPLHLAAMEGHADCITSLLVHKAYVNFVDFSEERYTSVDYARLHGHSNCVQILSEAGGVATEEIRDVAALTIQTAYRGHRARLLRSELALKSRAVTSLAKYIRGFLQRRRFAEMKRQHYAAIKIQSLYRGHVERVQFRIQLHHFREQKERWQLIENFSKLVQHGREIGMLQTFDTSQDLVVPEYKDDEEACEKERRLRLETSMQMRVIYQEKQTRWQAFRDAERQRRLDKAKELEMNRLNNIIAESRARREYTHTKFHHTLSVRRSHQAAITIQRAFRRMRLVRAAEAKLTEMQESKRNWITERAVRVIQRNWRAHQQEKLYRAMHFRSIMTGPVLAVGQRGQSPLGGRSYEKSISITGSPQRKRHQTLPSGFQVFRPLTRDLLHGVTLSHNTSRDVSSRPESLLRHESQPGSGSGLNRGGRSQAGGSVTLPKVFKEPVLKSNRPSKPSVAINLPDITN